MHGLQIKVRVHFRSVFALDVEPTNTITDLKRKIYRKENITTNRQVLSYNGRLLKGRHTLWDRGIQSGSVIDLRIRRMLQYEIINCTEMQINSSFTGAPLIIEEHHE